VAALQIEHDVCEPETIRTAAKAVSVAAVKLARTIMDRRRAMREKPVSRNSLAAVLRRTCTRLWHQAGGELDQIQFLLGHLSMQTTERYLGCKRT
jgi:integrase